MSKLRKLAFATTELYGGFKVAEHLYERSRERKLPAGGIEQSMLPFYELLLAEVADEGMIVAAAGGIVKQALKDPDTEFDVDKREYRVRENSSTLAKATLYRPKPEMNLRDLDVRVLELTVHGKRVPALPEFGKHVRVSRKTMQNSIDYGAQQLGFGKGPVLSLFTYEPRFERPFLPTDYATRTRLNPDYSETLFDNNGNEITVTPDPLWTCIVPYEKSELRIPTNSPQTILGRTLVRPVVARQRDIQDVTEAVQNITNTGLQDELLGESWMHYREFRARLDESVSMQQAIHRFRVGNYVGSLSTAVAIPLIPAAGAIERSFIGMAIRDPESPIYSIMSKIMGAK